MCLASAGAKPLSCGTTTRTRLPTSTIPTPEEVNVRFRNRVKALFNRFGSDTADGYREEFEPLADAVAVLRKKS